MSVLAREEGAGPVLRPSAPDRTAQIRIKAPPKQNRRLRVVRTLALSSPDLGCPRGPIMLLELPMERHQDNRDPRAPSSASALAEYNCRRVLISKRPWIANDGFSCRPPASIPAELGLAHGLRASCRARFEPHAGQRQILRFFPPASVMGGDSGCTCLVAAGNGAPIRRNAVRRRNSVGGGRELHRDLAPRLGGNQNYSVVGAQNVVRASGRAPQIVRGVARRSPGQSFSMFGACPDAGFEPWAARTSSSWAWRKGVALHLTTLPEAGT
jgi:hypothetical protein